MKPEAPLPAHEDGQAPTPSLPDWQRDLFSSIVVFLVALPLCIGIAVAVGVSPGKALITGIIGGIVCGFVSGTPLQVSGPAAGLFLIVKTQLDQHQLRFFSAIPEWQALDAHGRLTFQRDHSDDALAFAIAQMAMALLICGVIQIAAGRFALGQWFRAVSPAVVHGMLAGIGILIVATQFHVMLDNNEPMVFGRHAHSGWEYLFAIPGAVITALQGHATHIQAAMIGVTTIVIIIAWQRLTFGFIRLLPGALVAVIVAAVMAGWWGLQIDFLRPPENLWSEITLPNLDTLAGILHPDVVLGGILFALVGGAESLLCSTAVDQMHKGQRTNYDQELFAQGVGNFCCGLVGVLPLSGVIVRSSANVQAGAATRWSTILHGLWLLVFILALPMVLAWIPEAALGAILVYTGVQLVKWTDIKELWELDKGELGIYVATALLIVIEDLLVGVAVGITLSSMKLLYTFSRLDMQLDIDPASDRVVLRLRGAATFLRLPLLAEWLGRVPPGSQLTIDLTELNFIDHACLELIAQWASQHSQVGGSVTVDWESLYARFHTPALSGSSSDKKSGETVPGGMREELTDPRP